MAKLIELSDRKRPKRIHAVYCYGPTHESEEMLLGGQKWAAREFVFAEGIVPEDLLAKGWRHSTTWICPDCVEERQRRAREAEKKKREE